MADVLISCSLRQCGVSGCLHLVAHQLVDFLCAMVLPQALLTMHLSGNSIPGAQTFINGWAPYFRCPEQPRLAPGHQEVAPASQKPAPADNRSLYPQMAPDLHWGCLLYFRATFPSCLSHRLPLAACVLAATGQTPGACRSASWLLAFSRPLVRPMHACHSVLASSAFSAGGCSTSCFLRQSPPSLHLS